MYVLYMIILMILLINNKCCLFPVQSVLDLRLKPVYVYVFGREGFRSNRMRALKIGT